MTTDMHQDNAATEEPWFRNPWVWLVIAIPALTVAGGLLTIYLAITNAHIMVSEGRRGGTSTTRRSPGASSSSTLRAGVRRAAPRGSPGQATHFIKNCRGGYLLGAALGIFTS